MSIERDGCLKTTLYISGDVLWARETAYTRSSSMQHSLGDIEIVKLQANVRGSTKFPILLHPTDSGSIETASTKST
jgi:hypothetical protein